MAGPGWSGPQRRTVAATRGVESALHYGVGWVRAHRRVVVVGGSEMRFSELTGLTGLPVDRLRHRFRNEDVLTVLPVNDELTGRDCVLVATPMKLAVVIADASPTSDEWMSRWAPWETLGFVHAAEPLAEADEDTYRLTMYIGGLLFHACLRGDAGRRWLRDFVVAAQARREAVARSV